MNRFTNPELADMHLMYGTARGNARLAARLYHEMFPQREVPRSDFFARLHMRLRENGSFNAIRDGVGRPRHPEEERILEHFHENPRDSTRSAAQRLGIRNHTTVWRALHRQRSHPYHFQRVQGLLPTDFAPRLQFATWLLEQRERDRSFSSHILFTDEAYFTRDGVFNMHNNHFWTENNPHVIRANRHQHRFSVNVWAGIIGNHLIGPYLLPPRLTGRIYHIFLRDVLRGLLEDVPIQVRRRMWFQHDGAPAHFFRDVRQLLDEQYPNRWIGRGGPITWPARSPDLSPLDYFLWGTMKDLIYTTPVESEEDLVGRIAVAAGDVQEMPNVFENVRRSLDDRCRKCIEVNGANFEHLL